MRHSLAVLLASILLVSGCGDFGKPPEDRINEAYVVAESVTQARQALTESLGDADVKRSEAIDAEMASRLKIRALTCGKGHEPGPLDSSEEIRTTIDNADCFIKYDETLKNWLNHRRIESLLSAPPLRPVPEEPPKFITAASDIGMVWFADAAGVVLLSAAGRLEILDVAENKPIFSETHDASQALQSSARISPNGRLFLTGKQGSLAIRDTQTGAELAEYQDVESFFWLDGQAALMTTRNNRREPQIIDFATGAQFPLRGVSESVAKAVPAPAEGEFVLCTVRTLVRVALERADGALSARIVDEEPLGETTMWSDGSGTYSSDYSRYVSAAGRVSVASLDPLSVRSIGLDSLHAQSAWPTPDPDHVLVTGYFRNPTGRPRSFVMSVRDLTIAPIDGAQEGTRYLYIPALDAIGAISRSRIEILDELPLGEFRSFEEFAAGERTEAQLRQLETFQRSTGAVGSIPEGLPVPDWARDADVEAVGVYESTGGSHGPGKPSKPGTVSVRVQRSRNPLVLVLTSYEPVNWEIETDPGARIAAILLGGYNPSRVSGLAGVRQIDIGRVHAYQQGDSGYGALEAAVARRTGKRIKSFQGRYSGESFVVGGR